MNKVAIIIATTALFVSAVSLARREVEILLLNETLDILHHLQDEIEFAKIVEHIDGED